MSKALELKGTAATLTVLRLKTTDIQAIERELKPRITQLPHFFQDAPIVLDLELLEAESSIPFDIIATTLRAMRLVPVAIKNATADQQADAVKAGFGLLKGSKAPTKDIKAQTEAPKEAPQNTPATPTPHQIDQQSAPEPVIIEKPASSLTIKSPVRGGQVIYAQGGDLVLLAPVNPGGEVIADGNIHAYAPIRGRALAGAHGNEDARIFCQNLDAELVAIAGNYLSAEEIDGKWRKKSVLIHLENEAIVVNEL